jgi:hypothetical protein
MPDEKEVCCTCSEKAVLVEYTRRSIQFIEDCNRFNQTIDWTLAKKFEPAKYYCAKHIPTGYTFITNYGEKYNWDDRWIYSYLDADECMVDVGPYPTEESAQTARDVQAGLGMICTAPFKVDGKFKMRKGKKG